MRDRLIELLNGSFEEQYEKRMLLTAQHTADALLAAGVIVPPCKGGDKVAVRALCECVLVNHCFEECRNICPFEDDCDCDDCTGNDERIFDTKVSAIYNNSSGWFIEFEHLVIQARFSDIGTSFFIGENAHEQAVAYNKALMERLDGNT